MVDALGIDLLDMLLSAQIWSYVKPSLLVTTAAREEDALEAIRSQIFDLAIVDLQLAQTDGISLMEGLHLVLPETPVIILTAYVSIESAVEAMKRGPFSYLTKPFDSQDLLLQIE